MLDTPKADLSHEIEDEVRAAMRRQLAENGLSATELARKATPGSRNTFTRFLSGSGLYLSNLIKAEVELGLPPGGLLVQSSDKLPRNLEALLTEAARRGARIVLDGGPSIKDFLVWHAESGGALELHSPLAEYIDVYGDPTPDGVLVNPIRFGAKTFASRDMKTNDVDAIKSSLADVDRGFLIDSAKDQADVMSGREISDTRHCNLGFSDGRRINRHVARVYRRGQFAGRQVALSFFEEI